MAKKKETITLGCGLKRKKYQFPRFPSFALYPKSKTRKSLKVLFLIKFLVVYKTQNQKYDLTEKTLTLQCGLRRKYVNFRGFQVFDFAQSETWKSQKVFVFFNFLSFWLH